VLLQLSALADVTEAAVLAYSSAAVTTFDIILEPREVATKD
jgi:hypothetical protein